MTASIAAAHAESKPDSLGAWLQYLSELNPEHMELGLERVRKVAARLKLLSWPHTHIIEVAGTNGKGSTAALVAGVLGRAGIRCALYTSPHLHRFNERAVVSGREIPDEELCRALSEIWDLQRDPSFIPLTYFEYTTLAALIWFKKCSVQALVLEIGLGGRLDAVNMLDAEIAVITSIGLDHTRILGSTLGAIASEKAGIIKPGCRVVTGELPPEALETVRAQAQKMHAALHVQGESFKAGSLEAQGSMSFSADGETYILPYPRVPFECAAVALEVIRLLRNADVSIPQEAVAAALSEVVLPGRMQLVHQRPRIYLDVAHNPPAAEHLRIALEKHRVNGARRLVIGMLRDKDIESVLGILSRAADKFYAASLHTGRGESSHRLKDALLSSGVSAAQVAEFDEVACALERCLDEASSEDEIVICGSFVTVTAASEYIQKLVLKGDHSWL